jgi:hypothetical protein
VLDPLLIVLAAEGLAQLLSLEPFTRSFWRASSPTHDPLPTGGTLDAPDTLKIRT